MPARPSRLLLAAAAALAALVAPAGAAASPAGDRVIAEEVSPLGVGVDGTVTAYSRRVGQQGAEIVVLQRRRVVRRIAAGRGDGVIDVGRHPDGRALVVFARCDSASRCEVRVARATGGPSRLVARTGAVADLTYGASRVFWADGRRVRSRHLDGGPVRREAVAGGVRPTAIDTDGRTLAATGDMPSDTNGATGLSVTRPGSGRARLRTERPWAEEYVGFGAPSVTRDGVTTLLEGFAPAAASFADHRAGRRGFETRTTGGMNILDWDASGGTAVLVEAPTDAGCEVGEAFSEETVAPAPCRIVLAATGGERLLPPRIAVARGTATVIRTRLDGGRVMARVPQRGVDVEVRAKNGTVVARLVTDAAGRVTLPEIGEESRAIVAATTPPSHAIQRAG